MKKNLLRFPDPTEGSPTTPTPTPTPVADPHAQRHAVEATIKAAVTQAAGVAGTVAPEFAVYIAMGRLAATVLPDLYETVASWIDGTEPTDDEIKALSADIADLMTPEQFFEDPAVPGALKVVGAEVHGIVPPQAPTPPAATP